MSGRRARTLAALHPTDLSERGEELARALKRLGHHDMALVASELAARVAEQHRAIAYKG